MTEYDVSYIDSLRVEAENVTDAERIAREQIRERFMTAPRPGAPDPMRNVSVFRIAMVWEKP